MGDIQEELEIDIERLLEQIATQDENDKRKTIKNMVEKYLHLNTCNFVMDYSDFLSIVYQAQRLYIDKALPVCVGNNKKKISDAETPNYCMILSTIAHLQKNKCFNKLPVFNEKEDKI